MKKCFINIILIFIFIIILINLVNLFKKNNLIEGFDLGSDVVDDLDKKINVDLTSRMQDLIDNINDATPLSLSSKVHNLYDRTKNLYDEINNDKKTCENEFDGDFIQIIDNYDAHTDKKCLKNISDILDAKHNLSSCAELCNNNKDCMSFSYDKDTNDCRLSTICHPESDTTFTQNFSNTLYVKRDIEDHIKNYKLNQNQQCNNLCHDDIIESSTKDNVHNCASHCENNDDSVSFEYNFNNGECTLRSQCKQGTHIEDSNEYDCDKGQIKSGEILQRVDYDIDRNTSSDDYVLDYYSLYDLKNKCNKLCASNVKCDAFSYEFTENENNCTLYEELEIEKDISKKFINICRKPENLIKKNLYTKKISTDNAQQQAQSLDDNNQCEALCENNVNDNMPYVKFYKNKNDVNYSYITFTDMYNIKEIENFNLLDYKFIEIKMGYKVLFQNNENYVSVERIFQNPDEYNVGVDKLKQTIANEDDSDPWRKKINVIKIIKLQNSCRGRMSECEYDSETETFKKEFKLFYGDDDDKQYCYELAREAHGPESANLLLTLMDAQECNDDVNCDGFWSQCIPDGNGVYKKQWIETRPPNGNGNCQDKYKNYIYSEGLSGCGSGTNEGYNNKNILKNCNPNNENDTDFGPFLTDGSYFQIGSGGENIFVTNNGSIITGSAVNAYPIGSKEFGSSTNSENLCQRF
tara:strand:+ start:4051 stop:6129 length:2079 start_codon:yes stop_codon:yes gene_type:complete